MPDRLIQEGPRDARIVLVGEAPGETEERTGRPFQGGSGELLNRMLERTGIRRSECFITNICHVRPPANKFEWFHRKENQLHLFKGVLQLKRDLEAIRPNIVVGLGAHPLRTLTNRNGIDKWRGSILETTLVKGLKCVCTYHPAYILRVYDYKAVAEVDLRRIATESQSPYISLPEREFILHPDGDRLDQVVAEMERADWLAVDIECWFTDSGTWRIACVGFSDRANRALVIHNDSRPGSLLAIRRLCSCPAKKVFQNGTFDVTVLRDEGIEVTNFAWDTMLAHHSLFAECASGADEISQLAGRKRQSAIQKGLAFQASIYTKEPFYKDDGKLWKQTSDLKLFWTYNAKDAAVTREIRDVQEKELAEFEVVPVFEHEMSLIEPLMAMTGRGVKIDLAVRAALNNQITTEIERLQKFLDTAAGQSVNVKSSPQITKLLYEVLKLPAKYNKKSGNVTADKDAINELAGKYKHPILSAILKIRERRDLIERYLAATVDKDGRMRCSFDITGTRSGRLSSRASIYGSGTNLQNIPARRKEGEQIRRMFVADPGKVFIYRDYSQAEARIVAYLAGAEGLIELFEDPTRDIHRENAARIFGKPLAEVTDNERYLAKKVVHASNYGMGPARLVELVAEESEFTSIRITFAQAQDLINRYFLLYPEIREVWWKKVEEDIRYSRTLTTPFGRKRTFFGRWDDKLLRDAYSYQPQSSVGWLGCEAVVRCYHQIEKLNKGFELLLQVHDSVLGQDDIANVYETSYLMQQAMAIPITINGRTFTIPTDCKVGLNWARKSDDNPNGLRDLAKAEEWLSTLPNSQKSSLQVSSII